MSFFPPILLSHLFNQLLSGFATRMLEAELTGVQSAIANLTERGAPPTGGWGPGKCLEG